MAKRNPGMNFDDDVLKDVIIDSKDIENLVDRLKAKVIQDKNTRISRLLLAIKCMDLTTLNGNDTADGSVHDICMKAKNPLHAEVLNLLGFKEEEIKVAAVCVYPVFVSYCASLIHGTLKENIPIASVAGGFPHGLSPLSSRLDEIKCAIASGANEIDIVINRSLVLCGKLKEVYSEVKKMKEICGKNVLLKAILAVGELGTLENVYKASMVCMMAGADFIKTSTGKETVNATLPFGLVMARAINEYKKLTGVKVGLKPAGGIKTSDDAIQWQMLVQQELGDEWLCPSLFRIGASSLLTDIQKELNSYAYGQSSS